MLVPLFLALALLHAQAAPTSFGSPTEPTMVHNAMGIVHTIILGRQTGCPMERTLVDIVRSCLLTIAACVYRAIHQNIPDPKASWWQRQWIRVKITLLALFAPEMMVWWAMKQWMGARVIRDQVNDLNLGLKWTLTHGHFVQMGGFIRQDDETLLQPEFLIYILRQGNQIDLTELRKITEREIQDHSKGDLLSEGLVTLQTTWFIFECIARWQQKLRITELEVVTLAFSVLNLLTYAFWWHKPLDVLCPIRITFIKPIGQPENASHPTSDELETAPYTDAEAPDSEMSHLVEEPHVTEAPLDTPERQSTSELFLTALSNVWSTGKLNVAKWVRKVEWDIQHDGFWSILFNLVVVKPFTVIGERLETIFEDTHIPVGATSVSTFYSMELPQRKWTLVLYLACFVGVVFGSIHFLSWNSHFPSRTETLLWRASSIILVVEPLLVTWVQIFIEYFNDNYPGRVNIMVGALALFMVTLPSTLGPIAYILARLCLLALAFLTLGKLPPDALQTVSWTSYIPHL